MAFITKNILQIQLNLFKCCGLHKS